MIQITDKHNCCGCSACGKSCSKGAISFKTDHEGFWYPEVDMLKCVDCGLCEKVCPFLAALKPRLPLHTFAAINPNEQERYNSSSGGIFSMLAREVINNGGIVFGAAFNQNWDVHHTAIESVEDIHRLQGSKYVQSFLGNSYCDVKKELNHHRLVLFSGTACQIAGLNQYLRKKYENLITIDVVCHGVPSPRVWASYLSQLCSGNKTAIKNISFRDKLNGWENYDFVLDYGPQRLRQRKHRNVYMQGFLKNLYLRPSCHQCKVRGGKCGSDLTLGDFWGIGDIMPEINDGKGISLVLANTEKGENALMSIGATLYNCSYEDAIKYNPCIVHNPPETKWRDLYWANYSDNYVINSTKRIVYSMGPTIFNKIVNRIKNTFKKNNK